MIEIKISYDTDPEAGAGEHPVLGAAVADRRAEALASTTRSRWRRPPTRCPSSRSPSAGSSRRIPTRPSRRSGQYVDVGPEPPGVPRARPRPAPLPRAVPEGSGAAAAPTRLIRLPRAHRTWSSRECSSRSMSPRPRAIPASRRSRSASCTGWRPPSPRSACSGRSPGWARTATTSWNCCWRTPPPACPTTSASASATSSCTRIRTRAIADIVDRYHHVADRCDAVVIVGSDYTDVATPSELSINARIAANLGAPVVLAVQGQGPHPRTRSPRSSSCVWSRWPPSTPTPRRWWPTVATRRSWPRSPRR